MGKKAAGKKRKGKVVPKVGARQSPRIKAAARKKKANAKAEADFAAQLEDSRAKADALPLSEEEEPLPKKQREEVQEPPKKRPGANKKFNDREYRELSAAMYHHP